MKKSFYLVFVFVLILSQGISAQTRIEINVGDDLIGAVKDASDGDTLYLMQGLHKAQYETIELDKSLVFKGEPGADLPMLYLKQMDAYADGINLTILGLEISGFEVDSVTGEENQENLIADYVVNLVSGNTGSSFGDITIKNCIIRNINKSIVRGDRDTYTVDNFVFDDIIAYDFRGGSDYGPFRLKSRITFDTFTLTNSTFYNFLNKIIDCQDVVPSPMDILIENCTFYNMGGGKSGNYLFDIEDNDQASLVIRSCILGNTNQSELVTVNGWRVIDGATLQMTNSVMTPNFVVTEGTYEETNFDLTEYNLEDFDPEWADPDNGDFTLPLGSDLLMWSPEGTIVGDPRWNPVVEGIGGYYADPGFTVYPNPAREYISISLEKDQQIDLEIFNVMGRRVKYIENAGNNARVNISGLNNGIYFIRVSGENRKAQKLMVK